MVISQLRSVAFGELGRAELDAWQALQAADESLRSPYFHPSFTGQVAAVDARVRVVIGEDGTGRPESFLPVQVAGRRVTAAGWPAADFQGPVCTPGTVLDPAAVLRACGASVLHLDHLRHAVALRGAVVGPGRSSPFIEVAGGLESYLARVSASGRKNLKAAGRAVRKIEGELGGYRFEPDVPEHGLLDRLIDWKRRQYRDTGARDYFADTAHRQLLHGLLDTRGPDFAGLLSVVYAAENPISIHFGIRHRDVLHWWFPAYDPQYARLGPGWLLLRAVAEQAPQLGLSRLDLGRGEDDYKRRAMTGHELVHVLDVDRNPLRRHAMRAGQGILARAKGSRLGPALRSGVHAVRRVTR